MKKILLLHAIIVSSSVMCHAQPSITAGATTDMIYTNYEPDYVFSATRYAQDALSIDLNHDGINDFRITHIVTESRSGSGWSFTVYPYAQNEVLTKRVVARCFIFPQYGTCDSTPIPVAQRFEYNELMYASSDTFWMNSSVTLESRSNYAGGSLVKLDFDHETPNGYYYLLRLITSTDTLLGYLQLSTGSSQGELIDFACQGPTSSYLISSVSESEIFDRVKVFPNPFNNTIYISYETPLQYSIMDASGRLLLNGVSNSSISTDMLTDGLYFFSATINGVTTTRKLIKYRYS